MAIFVRLEALTSYALAHALQERLVLQRADGHIDDVVLLLEHPETITLGRHRTALDSVLEAGDVPVVRVERGGNATWHAPGQLVAYPMIQLEGPRRDLHDHLHRLEDAVIGLLGDLGVRSGRDDRNTGVWIGEGEAAQKVCSIGIACRRWVTWHGLAVNLDIELAGFARIRPCGFGAGVMTRVAEHMSDCPSVDDLARPLRDHLASALGVPVAQTWSTRLEADADIDRIVSTLVSLSGCPSAAASSTTGT